MPGISWWREYLGLCWCLCVAAVRPLPPPSIVQQPRPQLCRPLGTYTREEKHPSSGGNPYSQDMHEEVITRHQLGLPIVSPELMALCQQYQYPSVWACRQYIRQFNASGHARPKYATGNHIAEVLGLHLVRLALYQIVHPEGTIAEARAFLFIWIWQLLRFPPPA